MTKHRDECIALIDAECADGMMNFGEFHSRHEGLAVIEEETWEFAWEADLLARRHDRLREAVFTDNYVEATTCASNLYAAACNAMVEAMQVAAMAQKFLKTFGGEENKL